MLIVQTEIQDAMTYRNLRWNAILQMETGGTIAINGVRLD